MKLDALKLVKDPWERRAWRQALGDWHGIVPVPCPCLLTSRLIRWRSRSSVCLVEYYVPETTNHSGIEEQDLPPNRSNLVRLMLNYKT